MQIKTLKYFVVLAESHSINEAAQRLYLAQPSLTKSLQQLEQELGLQLFYRSKGGISLTDAGRQILPQARQMVDWYNSWLELSQEKLPKAVDIYVHTSLSGFLLPEILLRFGERYPNLTLNYVMTMRAEEYVSYDPQRPSLALTLCNRKENLRKWSKVWNQEPLPLFHGSYGCLVNREGSLASRSAIPLKELENYCLLLPDVRVLREVAREDSLCDILYDLVEKPPSGMKSVVVTEVSNAVRLLRKEKEAYVVTFSPACKRYDGLDNGNLCYIPFQDYCAEADLYLFYSGRAYQHYPVVQQLVQSIRDEAMAFLTRHGDESSVLKGEFPETDAE